MIKTVTINQSSEAGIVVKMFNDGKAILKQPYDGVLGRSTDVISVENPIELAKALLPEGYVVARVGDSPLDVFTEPAVDPEDMVFTEPVELDDDSPTRYQDSRDF
jgi:hypothetical protein